MLWIILVGLFIGACFLLSWLSSGLVKSLVQVAQYLHWKEFIIAFFVIAFAASLPNLFVDLNAALQGKPEIALGDIIGGNLIDLTLVLAIAAFFSKKGISAQSKMVQDSALFTTAIALLPILLLLDKRLDRIDGLILISVFLVYVYWLFSKSERFKKVYHGVPKRASTSVGLFIFNIVKILFLLGLLILCSQVVIVTAQFFSDYLGISLALVGILIIALGNAFPETYFAIVAARREENWIVLGDLMGSVIICSTMILGTIVLVAPFTIYDLSPFLVARAFLIAAALFSLLFIRSNRQITKKEGLVLLALYISFLLVETIVG